MKMQTILLMSALVISGCSTTASVVSREAVVNNPNAYLATASKSCNGEDISAFMKRENPDSINYWDDVTTDESMRNCGYDPETGYKIKEQL
jgi:hypothetical protein